MSVFEGATALSGNEGFLEVGALRLLEFFVDNLLEFRLELLLGPSGLAATSLEGVRLTTFGTAWLLKLFEGKLLVWSTLITSFSMILPWFALIRSNLCDKWVTFKVDWLRVVVRYEIIERGLTHFSQ